MAHSEAPGGQKRHWPGEADTIDAVSLNIQKQRWQARLTPGFNPASVSIPKRFTEVTTWKGKVDGEFLTELKNAYGQSILKLAQDEDQ